MQPRVECARRADVIVSSRYAAAASDLGARAILTGRIVRRDDTFIVQTDLIDTMALSQIWGRRYERTLADFQDVQEEITTQVAAALRVRRKRARWSTRPGRVPRAG